MIGIINHHIYNKRLKLPPINSEPYKQNHFIMRSPPLPQTKVVSQTGRIKPWNRHNHSMGTALIL